MSGFDWFPTHAGAWHVEVQERPEIPDTLNLKSCELLQPRVQRWHAERLAEVTAGDVVAYPANRAARSVAAGYLGVESTEVLLTPGTDHAIRVVAESLCVPAGRLVIADPHFDRWSMLASHYGYKLNLVPAPAGGEVEVGALIDAMRASGPAVVVLTQPDSISGRLYTVAEVVELEAAVQKHGSLLVLDTCYLAFAEDGEDTVVRSQNVLRINSFSKSLGLAGARIGAMAGPTELIDYLSRWRVDCMIGGPSLRLLRLALALTNRSVFEEAWEEVRQARSSLVAGFAAALPGWRARPSGGNFLAFDAPPDQAAQVHRELAARGIRTRLLNGLSGFPGGIRIATPGMAAVERVLAAMPGRSHPMFPTSELPER